LESLVVNGGKVIQHLQTKDKENHMQFKKPLAALLLTACRIIPETPNPVTPENHTFVDPPAVVIPEAGVCREKVIIPGFTPAANPVTQSETPTANNVAIYFRYREDTPTPKPARAIIVAMPGFLGGGPSFDALARALVKQGISTGETVEVWAIDRRSNLLEDTRGFDSAFAFADPEIAHGYYFGNDTVGGVSFDGFRSEASIDFMSEWGLETHAEDLRRVIDSIQPNNQNSRVFLMGHSLGASFAEAYAAWRFSDDTRGVDALAGIILLDGLLQGSPISESEYLNGVGGALSNPGITGIREETRTSQLPILGQDVYTVSQILALRALEDPTGIIEEDDARDSLLEFVLSVGSVPKMTNEAALAFGFDDASSPLAFAVSHLGESTGGPLEEYTGIFGGTLVRPSDPNATYSWIDAFDTNTPEFTPLRALIDSMTLGGGNFYEWYFPARLALDLSAVGGARVEAGSYQEEFGLRATDGAEIDVPILAVATSLISPTDYESLRARVAQTIGVGPNTGATRNEEAGFSVLDLSATFGHLDPVTAPDSEQNPIPERVFQFVLSNVEAGTITVP
jgi:pimeloyl-ACP methyl ester carboxylesterase